MLFSTALSSACRCGRTRPSACWCPRFALVSHARSYNHGTLGAINVPTILPLERWPAVSKLTSANLVEQWMKACAPPASTYQFDLAERRKWFSSNHNDRESSNRGVGHGPIRMSDCGTSQPNVCKQEQVRCRG